MAHETLTGLFAERYLIERELGHGATAVVYLAHDKKHDRQIALKVLSKDLAHALGPQRFLREIHLTSRLHHPHILPIFDSGEWKSLLYYVLPYVRGESLREKIDREKQLPIEECTRVACEVADALAHAHAHGVVHRDVKPENIMLSDGHALLADFGIARALDIHTGERLTSSGLIVGTSAYMSPEQAAGEETIDARSDIYSLACVLYEMIAGVQPFTGPTTQSVIAQRFKHTPRPVSTYRPQVPEYLERALEKGLAVAPADRYRTVQDFAAELPEVPTAGRDRRQSPVRRALFGKQKTIGFAAAALAALTAAFVAANPPGNWGSLFRRSVALDSTRYIVVPSPTGAQARIGAGDFDAANGIYHALQKWNGITLVDPDVVKDAVAAERAMEGNAALDLARRHGAGRLIRVNSAIDATIYDVGTGNTLRDVSRDDLGAIENRYPAALLRLLSPRDRPKTAEGGDGMTSSLPAWRAYGEGHAALARNDAATAARRFQLALLHDPAFTPARLWNAQLAAWLYPAGLAAWAGDAERVSADLAHLTGRDRLLASGLVALARRDFPTACAEYRKLIASDSSDVAAWLGLGECQRLDNVVLPSSASPSGFRFRGSYRAASDAYVRAVRANPGAYDLVGYTRMREVKRMEPTSVRFGRDSAGRPYGSYPALSRDTVGYLPYPIARFSVMPASASRRSALEKNLAELLAFATNWVGAAPRSAQGREALATALEARGEIDRGSGGTMSASAALASALRLSTEREQRVRLVASEIRLRIKRGDYAGAQVLSDSLLRSERSTESAVAQELIGPAAVTGRMSVLAKIALATNTIPDEVQSVRVPPQVGEAVGELFAHAALGDCTAKTARLQVELQQRLTNYFSEKERAVVSPVLLARTESFLVPCTRGQSALRIQTPDRLGQMQQAYARGDLKRVRLMFDSLDGARRLTRPADRSLDYTFQEAWLRAATSDTAGAIRQLDEILEALPSVAARALKELGGAAALGRAMMLRADLAAATGDRATARRFARALSDLWAGADPELQPQVLRMRKLASDSK